MLSLACLDISFVVKGAGAVILLFRLEYKTSVICHNVNTQKVKIARRDRPHILASNRCETFENLLHIDIASSRDFTLKKLNNDFYQYRGNSITGIKRFIFQENFTFSSKQSLTQRDSDKFTWIKCSVQQTGLCSVKFIYSLWPTSSLIHDLFIYFIFKSFLTDPRSSILIFQ